MGGARNENLNGLLSQWANNWGYLDSSTGSVTVLTAGHILGQDCHTFVMGLPAGFQLHASCYNFVNA